MADTNTQLDVITEVKLELIRQRRKWGVQQHKPGMWSLIMQEELGEVAQACLQQKDEWYIAELIQVAAVAISWAAAESERLGVDLDSVEQMLTHPDKYR